jgi:hypothetical protein
MAWGTTGFRWLAVAIAVTVAAEPALAPVATSCLGDVGEQRELASAFDRACDLTLMTAAGAGDPSGADLAPFGDEPAECANVLVVDPVDLVATVRAWLAPAGGRPALPIASAYRPSSLLCQLRKTS